MTSRQPVSSIPSAWLKPLPENFRIPLWRWFLLPATALMLKRSGGVWINGTLALTSESLDFSQSKIIKTSSTRIEEWSIPLGDIANVAVEQGLASETLQITHAHGAHKLMTARSADFVGRLRKALAARGREKPQRE